MTIRHAAVMIPTKAMAAIFLISAEFEYTICTAISTIKINVKFSTSPRVNVKNRTMRDKKTFRRMIHL